ncbi:recombinase family protein [Amycolatopsis sp. NPDC023774]|uniref:recombinase family protein n=1 Tax=Amycolatopsis sp. NPDC023774 TaxID=3155015 RepID=UPI0033F921B2
MESLQHQEDIFGVVSTRHFGLPVARAEKERTLTAAGCDEIFLDKDSGKLARRPELDKALLSANRAGDQLVVAKLDRLGRSLEHLIELSKQLQAKGTWWCTLMSERTMDGLAAARARGRTGRQNRSSVPARCSWPGRCTTSAATTATAATPSPRSPPSSASPAPPSTSTGQGLRRHSHAGGRQPGKARAWPVKVIRISA